MKNIYWININYFDLKTDKSTWFEISEVLTKSAFNITLLTGFKNKKFYSKKFRLKIKYFKALSLSYLFKLSLNILILLWLLKKVTKNDIIFVSPDTLFTAYFIKKLKKCKIHLDIRTIPVEIHRIKDKLDKLLFWKLPLKIFASTPCTYSFITELLKENIEKDFRIKFFDYVIWTSGVNISLFKINYKPKFVCNERIKITYLGVVTQNRGIDRVIHAINTLNYRCKCNILFEIIGNGPYLPYLRNLSTRLGLNSSVNFTGYIPYEYVPTYLNDTDIFICPLPDRIEWQVSSPIKVFEYLACSKPVILTPIIAHKAIISDEFVIWTKGDTKKDFENAIEYTVKNYYEVFKKSANNSSIIANKYDWHIQAKKLLNYLNQKYYDR